jgi:hypothetical protein
MAEPYDRWHKANPKPGDLRCREHNLVPSACHSREKRWQARWRDETGQQRKENYDRRADAKRAGAIVKVDLLRGT